MKRWWTLSVIEELLVKTQATTTPFKTVKPAISSADKNVMQLELSFIAGGKASSMATLEDSF